MIFSMKHAGREALDRLAPLIEELRSTAGLVEKKSGIFYRKSKAFLHFHEDPSGLYADIRVSDEFERRRVETAKERAAFLSLVRRL
jgi:hypothetical protein